MRFFVIEAVVLRYFFNQKMYFWKTRFFFLCFNFVILKRMYDKKKKFQTSISSIKYMSYQKGDRKGEK